ncbi:transcription elongation regulator 1-like protein [Conger conger]|uniref:transcription elongation regulator 1-like protein n=1 Tax=Conger conger TaxID=82655 RepID=UPI002A5AB7F5|nr:transcription elongation regulator 1-like protein [Conger conger]
MGATPPPVLISSHPPPVLLAASGWRLTCEPLLPLMPVPFKPEPAVHQWELHSQTPDRTVQSAAGLDLVPVFPHAYGSVLPPAFGKRWVEKRIPAYQVYLNAALTLDSAWTSPEEMGIFQRHGKPLMMTNQVAVNIFRPVPASRNIHALSLSPQRVSGCPVSIKQLRSNKRTGLRTSVGLEPEVCHRPPPTSTRPFRLLTLAPIKRPVWPSPGSGPSKSRQVGPVTATQVATVTSLCPPAVKFVATDWIGQPVPDKSSEIRPEPTLDLCEDQKPALGGNNNGDDPLEINTEAGGTQKDKRPVASTPVPGSPWCVVWTGDDRVFFFNPTMQLSVWEKPVDLKGRGDLSRIMKDPPHKRKKEESTGEESSSALIDDESVEQIIKRNKMEEPAVQSDQQKAEEELSAKISPGRTTLPLEVRISHFRDMLLERGVSAFSTWEKELYKIVFDPRYLLLSPDERKQIFEQFVKMRMKEEHKEKKSKQQQAKEEFRKLLEDSRITSRSTFKEFSEKYGRDQRFKRVPKKKDQEHLFSQFVSVLKKRDKENRLRLRKMR